MNDFSAQDFASLCRQFEELLRQIQRELGHAVFDAKVSEDLSGLVRRQMLRFDLNETSQAIFYDEILGLGPLHPWLEDNLCTEILVNSPHDVFVEHAAVGFKRVRPFLSDWSFARILAEVARLAHCALDLARPEASGTLENFRVQFVGEPVSMGRGILSLRRIKQQNLRLINLLDQSWGAKKEIDLLCDWVRGKKNIVVIGPTGVGKTSVISALLDTIQNERVIILEDTDELLVPNPLSIKLLTRAPSRDWVGYDHKDLLKIALRLRPERIVLGEIRGEEAKDYLLAMSSGHCGSVTSLHATSPEMALRRLELLVMMGAPQWSTSLVRELIFQTVDGIAWLGFADSGSRVLKGLYELASLEDFGITIDPVDPDTFTSQNEFKHPPRK